MRRIRHQAEIRSDRIVFGFGVKLFKNNIKTPSHTGEN